MFSNKVTPEFFSVSCFVLTQGMTKEQRKELTNRQRAYHADRKAAGLPDEAKTNEEAETLRLKLEPIATKHGLTLEICRTFLL
jgi:hypothetical protein